MRELRLASCLLLLAPALLAQAAPATKPAPLHWGPAPPAFPKGAQMAVVTGDPSKALPFEVEISLPNGYRIPPHFHPTDETVEVKKGTFMVGMGDQFSTKTMKPMKKGDQATVPAEQHHFAMARGRTVVGVKAMGPFVMTYVTPADDPREHGAKAKPGT
jgi:quercetin dioxygenase-like cupin family protein